MKSSDRTSSQEAPAATPRPRSLASNVLLPGRPTDSRASTTETGSFDPDAMPQGEVPALRRRAFLEQAGAVTAALFAGFGLREAAAKNPVVPFKISLAEWSLNRRIRGKGGEEPLDHLDFAKTARGFGIDAIEYVNQLFAKGAEPAYVTEMKKRADDEGVKSLLIMVDREGTVGDPDEKKRAQTIDNHKKWLDAAAVLGCHSIRVNAGSAGTRDEQVKLAADGLARLGDEGDQRGLDVIVENHGGWSSDGNWLAEVMKTAAHKRVGTLPDFGNFYIDRAKGELFDPYEGVDLLMPFAKAVSAKSFNWGTGKGEFITEDTREGREITLDFAKLMDIVVNKHGYHGYVGIEHEGDKHPEMEGITKTRDVLNTILEQMRTKAAA